MEMTRTTSKRKLDTVVPEPNSEGLKKVRISRPGTTKEVASQGHASATVCISSQKFSLYTLNHSNILSYSQAQSILFFSIGPLDRFQPQKVYLILAQLPPK